MIREHECVVLTQDLPAERLKAGDIGTVVRLVSGTTKRSCDACGALTTAAGRTFAVEASENGYRTSTTSCVE